jgi:hypothetical protein
MKHLKQFEYTKSEDGTIDHHRAYPVWDTYYAKHNVDALNEFNSQLDTILRNAGDTPIGKKKGKA